MGWGGAAARVGLLAQTCSGRCHSLKVPLISRFIQGAEVETPYVFYHWHHIDIFNYFSHIMVTIPPAVWTNAAHKHGVLVLGDYYCLITY